MCKDSVEIQWISMGQPNCIHQSSLPLDTSIKYRIMINLKTILSYQRNIIFF